ncbi:lasso peptide isopeptide bond-forming cyclase [Stenotrophomonas acidaminiphila]
MAYRYIALLHPNNGDHAHPLDDAARQLQSSGMQRHLPAVGCTLHVCATTPVIPLAGQGLILGHVFSRDGMPITHAAQLPTALSHAGLRRYILQNCWGAYLIVQPDPAHAGGITFQRDPEGGMPCIHHIDGGRGFIASDVALPEQLGRHRRRVDWDAVRHRLLYPDIKSARTALAGIQELLPGTRLVVQGERTTVHAAWSPWDVVTHEPPYASADEAAEAVRGAVSMATRAWAGIDRSILLELSGGLDSSVVGVGLKDSCAEVACCTLVTPVPGADERRYARQVAALIGAPMDADVMGLESLRHDFDVDPWTSTPRVGMLQHATDTIMEQARRRHGAASFFSGGGGDTVFCYLTSAAPAADAFLQKGAAQALRAIRDLAGLHQCTVWKAARLALRKLTRAPGPICNATDAFLSPALAPCAPDPHPWLDMPRGALPGERERIFALAATQIYRESAPRGMHAHLRLPLLSQPVMEATLRVPSWMWIAGAQNRSIVRQAYADTLPQAILARRSKGSFSAYIGALHARHAPRLHAYLRDGALHAQGIVDGPSLDRFFALGPGPRDRTIGRILDLCAVENWVRQQS